MNKSLKLSVSIDLNASIENVWFALTNKEMIKQYFWGTEVNSEWKEGTPITYSGTWEGTAYEDKGIILKIEKGKILKHSYWSSFWGTEYNADGVSIITYDLSDNGKLTTLTVTQEGFKDQQSHDHSVGSWKGILTNIKGLLEK